MLAFIAKRLAVSALLLVVISLLVFGLLQLSPGSVVTTLLGGRASTPDAIREITQRYHLDDPFLVQYGHWLGGALHGDLGRSTQSGATVTSVIGDHLPVTLQLVGFALALILLVGLPLGILSGLRHGGRLDGAVSGFTIVAMSAPTFSLGILLIYVFGVKLDWLPSYGAGEGGDRLLHLTLPAITLACGLGGLLIRQVRGAVMDVMQRDYVTFARARGLSPSRILVRYALRNSAVPIITATGLLTIIALSGGVLVEQVFSISGVGRLLVGSVNAKDIPVVQGLALTVAALVLLVNLLADLAARLLDPRLRQRTGA